MRKSIFKKSDYKLVNLPPPTSPPVGQFPSGTYPNAPVHNGVQYVQGGFKGSKVWVSNSPYPNFDDDYENPCVWHSNDSVYPPINFTGYSKNPIIGKIGNSTSISFSADPDILIKDGELFVFNREWWRDDMDYPAFVPSTRIRLNMYKGVFSGNTLTDFEAPIMIFEGVGNYTSASGAPSGYPSGSPSIFYDSVTSKFVCVDLVTGSWNDASKPCWEIRKSVATSFSTNCFSTWTKVHFTGYKIEPWHMAVFKANDKFYAIVCATERGFNGADSGRIYLGEFSTDLNTLTIFGKALTDFRAYRSSAFVDENGLFVLYANSYNDTFNGGTGVSGKDVFMTSRSFAEVLDQVKR